METAGPTAEEREQAALELMAASGASIRRTARRYSFCADDADDAYQRALEILLRKAPTTDRTALTRWTHTVAKHEALAVRRNRERALSSVRDSDAPDPVDSLPAMGAGPAEQFARRERIARSREALHCLKPQELRALVLKAEGYSYAEICRLTGWTHTKVNRCLAEGRKRFFDVYASIEEGRRCDELAAELSAFCDGESSPDAAERVRHHLKSCAPCRARLREYRGLAPRALGLLPLPVAAHDWWDRVHEWMGNAYVKLSGGEGVAAAGQLAAGGGARGAGVAVTAKVLAICAGTAGAGAACVATGVVPEAIRDQLPLVKEHRPATPPPDVEDPTDPPAEPARSTSDGDQAAAEASPGVSSASEEFAPLGSPSDAGTSSGGGSGGGGHSSGGGGAGGEFGP